MSLSRLEAIKAMLEGKKVTHDSFFKKNGFITFEEGGFYYTYGTRKFFLSDSLENEDGYSVIEEKKEKEFVYWLSIYSDSAYPAIHINKEAADNASAKTRLGEAEKIVIKRWVESE